LIKTLVLTALLLVLTTISSSFDPAIDDWYAVEDWELEVCSMWGGTQEAQSEATSSNPIYLSQTTLSLQGRKQHHNVPGVNRSLYTVSWYLEPLTEMDYRIELVNDDESITFRLDDGTASYSEPAAGYHTEYYDIEYTQVKMIYGAEWLKVPLITLI